MGRPIGAIAALGLLLALAAAHHLPWHLGNEHEPPADVPTFQRTAVESQPDDVWSSAYGSASLPLRSAVESVPDHPESRRQQLRDAVETSPRTWSRNQPLREAVERRPAPSFQGGFDHEAFWLEQLTPPAIRHVDHLKNVLCHFEAESTYREEPFALLPRALPAYKCTHLVYSAAIIDPREFTVIPRDPEYDIVKGGYIAAVGLRRRDPALRVLVSLSSADHGRVYREILSAPEKRLPIFVSSALEFLEQHDFDGFEIDWETGSVASLKLLLRHLRGALRERGYYLAVALRPEQLADAELSEMVDLLVLRSWHSSRDPQVLTTPAPLDLLIGFVERLTSAGAPPAKIIVGLPLFGWSYRMASSDESDAAVGFGIDGRYTKRRGQLAYYEICEKLEDQWQYKRHKSNGSYLVLGDQWIGYDDPLSMKIKAAYARSARLGGISIYSLDLDDFQGICGNAWPMFNAAVKTLGIFDEPREKCPKTGLYSDPDNCSGFLSCFDGRLHRGPCGVGRFYDPVRGRCVGARPEVCKPGHSDKSSYGSLGLERLRQRQRHDKLEFAVDGEDGPRVVCYLTSWAMYRKGEGKFVPEHIDARLCTDVVYAFAGLNPETLMLHPFDSWADIDNNLYERVTSIAGPRVLLALGGWTDSAGDKYSRMVSSPSARRKFVASAASFLRAHNFRGLSLEWNYPGCWQSDCRRGPETDRPNLTQLLAELRAEFDAHEPKLALAVAISGYKEIIDRGYDVPEISRLVDFMTVMAYDYHGAYESRTNHLAPLFAVPDDPTPHYNLNYTLSYLVKLGADRSKLIVDIPMYGQSYRLTTPSEHGLGAPSAGPGTAGEYTRQPGMLAYHEICDRLENDNWQLGPGPSAHHKNQFVSFDNAKSIAYKGQYVLKKKFGGVAAWTIDLDDFTNRCCLEAFPLLRSINRALGRLLTPAPSQKDCQKPVEPVTPVPPTLTPHTDSNDGKPMPSPTTPSTRPTTWPTWTERPTTPWHQGTTTFSWMPESTSATTTTTTTRYASLKSFYSCRKPPVSQTGSLAGMACNTGEHQSDPTNCGTFYRCVLGEFKREFCAPGLHWDSTRKLCDWPGAAKCQGPSKPVTTTTKRPIHEVTSPASTTTKRPTTTTTTTQNPGNEVCEHGQYYAYPDSCSHFLICVNGDLVKQQCGPGLNWNDGKNMCDWAFKNPCGSNKAKKQKHKAPLKQSEEAQKSCTSGKYLPVPGDCGSYYACLWGKPQRFQCAPGLHFNKASGICDWPIRAQCKPTSTGSEEIPPDHVDSDEEFQAPAQPSPTPATTLAPAVVDPDKVSPLSGHFKIVCYFTNWAWYRRGLGRYLPENIDHTLCTHIVYGFAVLDYSDLIIKAHDSWADFDNRFYERVVAYKKRGLKVSLALGGWNDSQGDKYSRLVNNPAARKRFVEQALRFVEKYGFDGLDLDWEYPVCWQTDCGSGPKSDKEGFAAMIRELSEAFRPRGLLLSSAVSPNKKIIDAGYDVPALVKYFDWIAVMTYDYHGQWDKKTGHVAPMYYHPNDDVYYFNANYTINYWISKGAPPRKLIMGMPLYGQSFSMNDPSAGTDLNVPASAGEAGEFTKAAGFLAYYEICYRIRNKGWQVVQDPERRMGPFAYKGNQWVSFDDADMIRQKAQFVRDMNLGGAMVWALDLDDFTGRCGEGPHPLMHTLQQVLAEPPNSHDRPIAPPHVGQELEWMPAKVPLSGSSAPLMLEKEDEYKVVCYFTNWAWYRQGEGKFLPEDIDADLCSHIIYGFAVLDGSTLTIKTHDSWADIDNKFYERVVAYRAKGKKVLVAIGGWNDSADDKYSRLANNPSARQRFIANVLQFIEKYGFDGLDLDWEYPVCWQVDCTRGPKSDRDAFSKLIVELSNEFKPRGLLLSSAVSPNNRVITEGYDVPVLAQHLDWIAVMTYDYHGQWDKKTGHNAPFYARPDDWEPTFNANYSIHYWLERGAPPKKLIMGVPLYGQSFSLAESKQNGLNALTYGGGEAGDATRARGFLSYYEICQRTLKRGWTVVQDPERRIGPYAYKGDQWVSFDDAEQVRRKSEFIKELGLGGGMVWALDLDDFKNYCGCEPSPLLRTMNRVLGRYPPGPLCQVTDSALAEPAPGTTAKPSTAVTATSPGMEATTEDDTDTVEVEAVDGQPPVMNPIGDCHNHLFIPHKKDCRKYYLCNFGQLTELTCPNGLVWNEDHCDWPMNTKCNVPTPGSPDGDNQLISSTSTPSSSPSSSSSQPTATLPTISTTTEHHHPVESTPGGPTFGGRKLVCYFTNWAWYRPGAGKYLPEDIDPSLCTHIVYGFAVLDYEGLVIKMHDSWADVDNRFYERVTALTKKGIKVLIGLGGWNDSQGDKYSRLVNNPAARKRFVQDILRFIEKHGFSGLDLDWEYPVCWQVDCGSGPKSDKQGFSEWARELSEAFRPRGLLLSAAVSSSKRVIDHGYDVPKLASYLDWIAVMAYDYHGQWDKKTGHLAPLYYYPGDDYDYFNANFSMRYWISKGAPAHRLVMGTPMYGQSFTLAQPGNSGLQAHAPGPGQAGEFTRAAGFLAFYEICSKVKRDGWTVVKDPEGRIGPYATRGDQWVGYDDVSDVARKAKFIRDLDLGGGMIWALDLDDFRNSCGCGKYPLLNALARGLRGEYDQIQDCT
ncbi:probable chitinase 10 [Copidosoma floridanum]|uniref:probable chitinase 10 n=1 Tax=Copidosoma floridanum TaxID=29053 RepID=UPI0006C99E57|nr:probable chitinase 10 [Copidosoma floridanum]